MELTVQEWAARHDYGWHSNYKIKSKAEIFFEKCYRRPIIKNAWDIYKSKEATQEQKDEVWEILTQLDGRLCQDDNAAMMTGREVQAACDRILIDNMDISASIAKALEAAMAYKPNDWKKDDQENKDVAIQDMEDIIKNAVEGLREAMPKVNRIIGETELYARLPGNELPYSTRPDYAGCGDLKVKTYQYAPHTKAGVKRPSLPNNLNGIFEKANASQVAGFWALNGQKPPWLLYVSKDDYRLLTPLNCDQLQDEFLQRLVADSIAKNKAIETKLKKSNSLRDLLSDEFPDFHEWRKPPSVIKHAEKLWRSYDD